MKPKRQKLSSGSTVSYFETKLKMISQMTDEILIDVARLSVHEGELGNPERRRCVHREMSRDELQSTVGDTVFHGVSAA